MDVSALDQGSIWSQVAPAIEARQREIADRVLAENPEAEITGISGARQDAVSGERPGGDLREKLPGRSAAPAASENSDVETFVEGDGLTEAERVVVEKLAARDAEVRRHEMAHMTVGGQYASAPSYTYQSGPDGNRYAIGGEVQIDISPVRGDPQATITKMEIVKAAALAPAEPSSADRQIASNADQIMARALADLTAMRFVKQQGEGAGYDKRA